MDELDQESLIFDWYYVKEQTHLVRKAKKWYIKVECKIQFKTNIDLSFNLFVLFFE